MGAGDRGAGGAATHPDVVPRLLQGGAEEEAAAGDTCVLGTLDVPAGQKGPGWQGLWASAKASHRTLVLPGPARSIRVRVVDGHPFALPESGLTCAHTALPGAQGVLGDTRRVGHGSARPGAREGNDEQQQ